MGEFTIASGLQPSTMYKYFRKKDDIVWALVGKIVAKVSERPRHTDTADQSALNKSATSWSSWQMSSPINWHRFALWLSSMRDMHEIDPSDGSSHWKHRHMTWVAICFVS
jgi:AcrR family transcriptional regulator